MNNVLVEAGNGKRSVLSLIDGAEAEGRLSGTQARELHLQIMAVLKETILRRNAGRSTSIRTETAQELLQSVIYCMDVRCAAAPDHADCLKALLSSGAAGFYQEGLGIVRGCLEEVKALYRAVLSSRISADIIAYNETLDRAVPGFIASYDIMFGAHDTPCTIDYPLAHDELGEQGVLYIRQYLRKLDMENTFCRIFGDDAVSALLKRYGLIYRINCRDYLLNIFEIVLNQALLSTMLECGKPKLAVSPEEFSAIRARLRAEDGANAVGSAFIRMTDLLRLSGTALAAYMQQSAGEIRARLSVCLENGTLGKLLIV